MIILTKLAIYYLKNFQQHYKSFKLINRHNFMFDFSLITKELQVFGAGLSNNEIKELENEYYEKEEVKPNDFEEEKKINSK